MINQEDIKLLNKRPVYSTYSDKDLFVNRTKEIEELMFAIKNNYNSLIVGNNGEGKTSLLYKIFREFEDSTILFPIITDMSGINDKYSIVDQLINDLLEKVSDNDSVWDDNELGNIISKYNSNISLRYVNEEIRKFSYVETSESHKVKLIYLEKILDHLESKTGRKTLFFIDNLSNNPDEFFLTFGTYRDYLWNINCQFCVTCSSLTFGIINKPPLSSFFDRVIKMNPFTQADFEKMFKKRGVIVPKLFQFIKIFNRLSPRFAIEITQNIIFNEISEVEIQKTIEILQGKMQSISDSEKNIFQYVLETASVSASDEDLQKSFNISRSRVVQILKKLEEVGLLDSNKSQHKVIYSINNQLKFNLL